MNNSYVYPRAEEFLDEYLKCHGYEILQKQHEEDKIIYKVSKSKLVFAIFLFAFAEQKNINFDRVLYEKLLSHQFVSKNTIPLIAYLKVQEHNTAYGKIYSVHSHGGDEFYEFWRIANINGDLKLVTYLREGWLYLNRQLTNAYNNMDEEALFEMCTDDIKIVELSGEEYCGKRNVLSYLRMKKAKSGNAIVGYFSSDNVIYFASPFVKDHFFISYNINQDNKICSITFNSMHQNLRFLKNEIFECSVNFDTMVKGELYGIVQ